MLMPFTVSTLIWERNGKIVHLATVKFHHGFMNKVPFVSFYETGVDIRVIVALVLVA